MVKLTPLLASLQAGFGVPSLSPTPTYLLCQAGRQHLPQHGKTCNMGQGGWDRKRKVGLGTVVRGLAGMDGHGVCLLT